MGGRGRVLVLVPDLRLPGGVTHYYATVDLDRHPSIDYFYVNSADPETALGTVMRLVARYGRFLWLLVFGGYRLVHVNPSLNARSFYRDGVFIGLARLLRRPVLITMHGWDEEFAREVAERSWLRGFFRATFARVQGVIVLGKLFQERLQGLGVPQSTPFWIDTTVAEPPANPAPPSPVEEACVQVLFMSRVLESKGIFVAMEAVAMARSRLPDTRIVMVVAGDGPDLERAKDRARQLGLEDVLFTGYVRGPEKQRVLAQSDVLLFPTWYGEGLPCVVLEAMSHGLVVITRPVGGIPEVVQPGEHGYLLESTRPEDFAEVLVRVIGDEALRQRIAEANRRAARRFGKEAVEARILEIHASLLGDPLT
ncbi:MAG TPA: glycosyltransferase [Chromatiales bacterium]|nr:glycosyltransferase [Chromatiales bacterium]